MIQQSLKGHVDVIRVVIYSYHPSSKPYLDSLEQRCEMLY